MNADYDTATHNLLEPLKIKSSSDFELPKSHTKFRLCVVDTRLINYLVDLDN